MQTRKFTETKFVLTYLPPRQTSPLGFSFASQAKQLPKLPPLETPKSPTFFSLSLILNLDLKIV